MHEQTELLVATNNAGKVRELSQRLKGLPLRLRLLSEFPSITEADETGQTFVENASLKAEHYSKASGLLSLADDSGLSVDALGGSPGVYSARYAGPHATYAERIAKLLDEIAATGAQVAFLALPHGVAHEYARLALDAGLREYLNIRQGRM